MAGKIDSEPRAYVKIIELLYYYTVLQIIVGSSILLLTHDAYVSLLVLIRNLFYDLCAYILMKLTYVCIRYETVLTLFAQHFASSSRYDNLLALQNIYTVSSHGHRRTKLLPEEL